MIEYALIINQYPIDSVFEQKIIEESDKRTILSEDCSLLKYFFNNRKIFFLGRKKYDYQGDPIYIDKTNFVAVVGYIVSDRFENSRQKIGEKVYYCLSEGGDISWLDNCLGEFQILHINQGTLNLYCSKLKTHPVYYKEGKGCLVISNRTSLVHVTSMASPRLDIQAQLEIIAYDSLLEDRTAFEEVHSLRKGHRLCVSFEPSPRLHLVRDRRLWADTLTQTPDMGEAFDRASELKDWLLKHLSLLPKQMKIDQGMSFNLSGGKDSRLLLSLFVRSGLMDFYDHVLTYGEKQDPEVVAACSIVKHYGLDHRIIPRGGSQNVFFEKLPLHVYQMEGEINCRTLHGNHIGTRKMVFTGHEAGLRESFADTEKYVNPDEIKDYILTRLPFDPIGFINQECIEEMRNEVLGLFENSQDWGCKPENFLNWFSIVGRGSRWVGKLTSMSCAAGLYANVFCSTPIVEYAHNIGVRNRKNEMFHFALLSLLDKNVLKYPFANQDWSSDITHYFGERFKLPKRKIQSSQNAPLPRWGTIYLYDDKKAIKRVINAVRHTALEEYIDYKTLFDYISRVDQPSKRAMLSLFAVISSNMLFHAGDVTLDGLENMRSISNELKKNFTKSSTASYMSCDASCLLNTRNVLPACDIVQMSRLESFRRNADREAAVPSEAVMKHQFVPNFDDEREMIYALLYQKDPNGDTRRRLVAFKHCHKWYRGIFVHSGSAVSVDLPENRKFELNFKCLFMPGSIENADDQIFEIYMQKDRGELLKDKTDNISVFSHTSQKMVRSTMWEFDSKVIVHGRITFSVKPRKTSDWGWTLFSVNTCKPVKL